MGRIAEDERRKLEAHLASVERVLRDAPDFVNGTRTLTEKGVAEREFLGTELEAIEQDLEAVRREHKVH